MSQVTVGGAPMAIAVRARTLWVANFDDDTVSRIERPGAGGPATEDRGDFPVGDGPVDVAVDETGVWVANSLDRTVSRLDPESGDMVATIEIGNEPRGSPPGKVRSGSPCRRRANEHGTGHRRGGRKRAR